VGGWGLLSEFYGWNEIFYIDITLYLANVDVDVLWILGIDSRYKETFLNSDENSKGEILPSQVDIAMYIGMYFINGLMLILQIVFTFQLELQTKMRMSCGCSDQR
jgi:hypothetical protein